MSDMGEVFRAMNDHSKVKRAMNRESSAELLTERGIPFVSKNAGAHLVVAETWDFWPGTGKFKHRTLPIDGRGVRKLINHIKESK